MILLSNQDHGKAIARAARTQFTHGDQVVSRVTHQGNLMGGVIYQDYTCASICMHVAGFVPNWLCRDLLWVAFSYPFKQLGCRKILVGIPESNLKSLEFVTKLGFNRECRIRDVYPDGDMIVSSMYREECRWLDLRRDALGEVVEHGAV